MLKALKIELLKIKGSKVLFIAILFPIFSVLQGAMFLQYIKRSGESFQFWRMLFSGSTFFYATLLYPMIIILVFAIITRLEHINNGWNQLLTFPIKRKNVYLSKLLLGCVIIFLNLAMLSIGIIIAGLILGGDANIPYNIILGKPILAFISSLPIISFQFFLSIKFKHIGVPLGIGSALTLPVILVINSTKYWIVYPFAYPMIAITPNLVTLSEEQILKHYIMYGVSGLIFIIIIGIGLLKFKNKDIM
ncbi:MAG: hypothetical protein FH751_06070 [Firmicutes bacterium]|nr:hypothetical protein [Bacillota bacterium]